MAGYQPIRGGMFGAQGASAPGSHGLFGPLPPADDLSELRRQQAAFREVRHGLDREYGWMAAPALAPLGALFALEGGAAIGARLTRPPPVRPPFRFVQKDPYLRVGDNWATRAGRLAHAALKERLKKKQPDGWESEPLESGLRPDVGAPVRSLDPRMRYLMELKPNTPSGRRAAAKAVKKYFDATGFKTRAIFYDPKDYL